ncbi:hypothetical protein ACQ4PT_069374 [Festuca glaucescens]
MAESVQNWRKKWSYIKDEKAKEQKFGLAPFDLTKSVKKLKSWDQPLTEAELEETEPLMARIHTLQTDEGKELSGLQIMTHFLRLRVQPIQARVYSMWNYMGSKDLTRISKEDLSTAELETIARQFMTLTAADSIHSSCRVTPFDKKHPSPAGHVFLSSLPPLPEAGAIPEVTADARSETPESAIGEDGAESNEDEASDSSRTVTSIPPANSQDENIKGKRKRADDRKSESSSASKPELAVPTDSAAPTSGFSVFDMALGLSSDEEETPKDPADERTQELSAFTTTPSKTPSPQEKVVDLERLERAEKSPQAPPKKKLKEHDTTKGIKISENPPMPSMDDPIAREMMDMAIRHIRFRDEAKSLEGALKKSQHRADELEAKLEAAGKALEEASIRATAAEEKLAEEKLKTATREADIRLRIDTLNASFISK